MIWGVWFAWRPVKISIVTRVELIHDEVIVEGYYEWKWFVNVARRDHKGVFYTYGPVTNVLTQPRHPVTNVLNQPRH